MRQKPKSTTVLGHMSNPRKIQMVPGDQFPGWSGEWPDSTLSGIYCFEAYNPLFQGTFRSLTVQTVPAIAPSMEGIKDRKPGSIPDRQLLAAWLLPIGQQPSIPRIIKPPSSARTRVKLKVEMIHRSTVFSDTNFSSIVEHLCTQLLVCFPALEKHIGPEFRFYSSIGSDHGVRA